MAEAADAYQRHVESSVFPKLRRLEGFARGRVLRRNRDGRVEFLVMTEWTSWCAILAFAGGSPDRAVVDTQARALLSDFDSDVDHFELVHESLLGWKLSNR
ncbi:MAG: antibiotic biosynthesis monooxygenase [Bryobacteraceae bacterium]